MSALQDRLRYERQVAALQKRATRVLCEPGEDPNDRRRAAAELIALLRAARDARLRQFLADEIERSGQEGGWDPKRARLLTELYNGTA